MDTDDTRPHPSDVPTPRDLRTAARGATIMAYAVGLAGVAVGTLALRDDDIATAVLVYVVTFGVGTCLVGIATLIRAVGGFAARLDRMDRDLALLTRSPLPDRPADDWRHGSHG